MNEKAYNLGRGFASKVGTDFCKRGFGKWIGYVTIGGGYFESDPYKEKSSAESEILGYLEGMQALIGKEIEILKNNINNIK